MVIVLIWTITPQLALKMILVKLQAVEKVIELIPKLTLVNLLINKKIAIIRVFKKITGSVLNVSKITN